MWNSNKEKQRSDCSKKYVCEYCEVVQLQTSHYIHIPSVSSYALSCGLDIWHIHIYICVICPQAWYPTFFPLYHVLYHTNHQKAYHLVTVIKKRQTKRHRVRQKLKSDEVWLLSWGKNLLSSNMSTLFHLFLSKKFSKDTNFPWARNS